MSCAEEKGAGKRERVASSSTWWYCHGSVCHRWTQQLQGVVAKGHHAAKRLASKAKAEIVAGAVGLGGGGGSESDSDDEHSR